MILQLDQFHQGTIRRGATKDKILGLKLLAVGVVKLVTMPVAFIDFLGAVQLGGLAAGRQFAGLCAQAHGAAHVGDVLLFVEQGDDEVGCLRIKLRRMRACQLQCVPGKFNTGDLHAEAQSEVRHIIFACVLGGQHLAFHAAFTKASRHEDAVHP